MRQKVTDLGLETWFHPTVDVQRTSEELVGHLYSFSGRPDDLVIQPGDLLHCDFGITYLRLNTDCQELAVLYGGEPNAARCAAIQATYGIYCGCNYPMMDTTCRVCGDNVLQLGISDHSLFAIDWRAETPRPSSLLDFDEEAIVYTTGQWCHVAAVSTEQEVRFYVNGASCWRMPRNLDEEPYGRKGLWIGAHPQDERIEYFFYGEIDELRVSSVARYITPFHPKPRFTPDEATMALYHFDEGKGNQLVDSSVNRHHGRVVHGAWMSSDDEEKLISGSGL